MNKAILIFSIFLLMLAVNAGTISAKNQHSDFPATPLGIIAKEWVDAINQGDEAALRSFIENRFSSFALKNQNPDSLLTLFRNLQKQGGGIEVVRFSPNKGELPMEIIIKSKNGNRFANVIIGLNEKEGKLAGIGIRKIENPEDQNWARGVLTEREMIDEIKRQVAKSAENGDFSGVVLVAKDDKILLNEAYGYADREAKIPNTTKTGFHLASVGKMFTSAAIAKLVKAGKISYTDTVAKILPDYPNRDIAQKVTIHHLLTHTAGMGTFFQSPGFDRKIKYHNAAEEIAVYQDEPLFFEPGARWRYSNAGYSLLSAIIERVSGKTYLEYIRENVLKPLKMNDTDTNTNDIPAKNAAVLYQPTEVDPFGLEPLQADRGILTAQANGFGGGFSTATDLYKFARAFRTGNLLGQESIETLVAPKIPAQANQTSGYGIYERIVNGETVRGHSGGGRADVAILWNSGYIVVVQVNVIPTTAASVSGKIVDFITKQESLRKKRAD